LNLDSESVDRQRDRFNTFRGISCLLDLLLSLDLSGVSSRLTWYRKCGPQFGLLWSAFEA
jgi:hypothetical protein